MTRHSLDSNPLRSFGICLFLSAVLMPGLPLNGSAQVRVNVVNPTEVLSRLATGDPQKIYTASTVITSAFRENRELYSDADRSEMLEGLERISRGDVQGDELSVVRAIRVAFSTLSSIALDTISAPEDREIQTIVERIYRESGRIESKNLAIYFLGESLAPYPNGEIQDLLVNLASSPAREGEVHPLTALEALWKAEDVAIPVLRGLNEGGKIQDPEAAGFLRQLAKRGYRKRGY